MIPPLLLHQRSQTPAASGWIPLTEIFRRAVVSRTSREKPVVSRIFSFAGGNVYSPGLFRTR